MERTRLSAASAALVLTLAAGTAAASAASLPRSHVVLTSALAVDATAGPVTLPLHRGSAAGKTVWYIVTDSSDKADAAKRGVVYAPLLDRVVAIDPSAKTVTLVLARGFGNGKRVLYLSTEASDAGAAAIERATFVPSRWARSASW